MCPQNESLSKSYGTASAISSRFSFGNASLFDLQTSEFQIWESNDFTDFSRYADCGIDSLIETLW